MSLVADGEIAIVPGESADDDSPGGPEVSESEREKMKTMIPGDSLLDQYQACPKATPGPDQSRKSSGIRKWEGIDLIADEEIFTSKKRTLRSDVAKQRGKAHAAKKKETEEGQDEIQVQKKRVLWSGVAKESEEGNTPVKKVAAEAILTADQNGDSSVISESNVTRLINCEVEITESEKKILSLHIAEQREGSDTSKINTEEETDTDKKKDRGDADASKKKAIEEDASGAVNGNSSGISERKDPEQMNCEREIRGEAKRFTRSDGARCREEAQGADTDKTKVNEEASAGVDQQGNDFAIREVNEAEQIISDEEIKFENNWIMKLGVANQRKVDKADEIRAEKKKNSRPHAAKGMKEADKDKKVTYAPDGDKNSATEEATPGAGQNGKCFTISKGNSVELIKCEEVGRVEKRITRSDVAKRREEAETIRKEVMEPEIGRKRSIEAFDVETASKRLKVESLRCRPNQDRRKDGLNEKKINPDLKKINRLEFERNRWIKSSCRRTLGGFKDNGARPVGVKRKDFSIVQYKSTRVLGRGGVLKALSCNKKVVGFGKDHIRRKIEENRKFLRPSSANKSQLCKTSPTEKKKSHDSKMGSKPNDLGPSNDKSEAMVKGESCSNSKAPSKKRKEAARTDRLSAKQKLRDQIKDVLLNAGWEIDLRPRKGRCYNDSVYISPQGNGYWSITKAYDVFQSQLNCTLVDNGKLSPGMSFETSKGSDHNLEGKGSLFSAIPMEALSILKKVFVNRRRSKKEIEEANKMRAEGSKNKKSKGASGMKHPKNKYLLDKGRDLKERLKEKNIAGSSAKGVVGYTRRKPHPRKNGEKQRGMALLVRGSNQETETGSDVNAHYPWRRTIFSWMMDLGIMPACCRVNYMNSDHTRTMLQGWITRNGIHCSCCSTILTVSKFEIHAGSKLCQPYQNIYLEDAGISLMQCQQNTWEKQDESVRQSFYSIDIDGDDPNDDTCGICGDGGDLICCDGCPSTFHLSCLGIQMLPPGAWHCMNCSCKFCDLDAGPNSEGNDITDSPLLSCSQCEEKYHQKCVPEGDAIPISSNFPCFPFCGKNCKKLFEQLRGLLGVKNDLKAGFSWTLLQRFDEDLHESDCGLDQRVECNSKIAVALGVMDECFLPIIDQRSGIDLIHNVVYNCGSNFSRLNYRGFYTSILERDDEVISVASLRIHGTRLAEMPFIGTRNMYRRQGMCRRLLNGIESALGSLNVEKLIIPAISELRDTWTNVFGFKPLRVLQKQEIRSINLLVFPGTGLLLKSLLRKSTKHCKTADKAKKVEPCSKFHHTHEAANESTAYSFIELEPDASADSMVQCEHEVMDKEASLKVRPDSSDGSNGSEPQASEYKPSDIAANKDLLLHHDEPTVGNKFQADSFLVSEIKLPSEGNAHDDNDASRSDHYEVQYTSPDAIPPCPQDSTGNDIHISVSSLGLSTDEAHHCRSEVTGKSSIPFPIGNGFQKHSERIVVDKASKILTPSVEPNIHAVGDYTFQTVHELKGQVAVARPKTLADGGNAEQCAHKIIKTPPDAAPRKESQGFCVGTASHDADIISVPSAFEYSDDGAIQHNSDLHQKPTESLCDAALPLSTEVHHGEHNSQEINDDDQTRGMVKSLDVVSKSNSSHDVRFENGPVAASCHAITGYSEDHADNRISRFDCVVPDYYNLTSGLPLNKIPDSTGVVQHNLAMVGTRVDNAIKPDLQSALETADMGNVHHDKSSYSSHTSTSGVSPLSSGRVASCEKNEMVIVSDQRNSLAPRHDSAD